MLIKKPSTRWSKKAEHPLRGMELQEKEKEKNEKDKRKLIRKSPMKKRVY